MKKIIGIDLGTTNSSCSIWQGNEVKLIPNELGEFLTPSVIHIELNKEGVETIIVGKTARERAVLYPEATANLFKRYMGTNREIIINKKKYSAVELSSFVLKSLKKDAEAFLGEEITEAVISVPAYFSDSQRKATILAGELIGLKVERLINEPTAAAVSYGLHERPEYTQFMVLDLGGGTFDVSIMEYFDGVLEVHATAGDNFLGGEDFLEILVEKYLSLQNLTKKHLSSLDLQKVYLQMEQVKRELNDNDIVKIKPFIEQQKDIIEITKKDFLELAKPLLNRVQRPVEIALRDAKLKPSDLNEIILVGGATRMSIFREMVEVMINQKPISNIDPDTVVVIGAAIQAGLKAKDKALDDVVLTDVCPYSLGTGVLNHNDPQDIYGDIFSPIIERNTVIPTSKEETYVTSSNNQKVIRFEIYQGESRLCKNNIKLGMLEAKVPKGKEGEQGAKIRFSYDMNGILEVDITVISTGEKHYALIKNKDVELTEKQIQETKEKLAKLKFHPREDATNMNLIARAERLYESRIGEDRERINDSLRWFEGVLETQDLSKIKDAIKEFADFLDSFERDFLL